MSLSIKKRMMLATASIVAIVCGLQAWLSIDSLTELTLKSVDTEMNQTGKATSGFITDWLNIRKQMLLANEDLIVKGIDASPQMLLTKHAGHFLSVYTGYDDGTLIAGDKTETWAANYDPRVRPWYQDAKKSDDLIITAPYRDVSGSSIISLAKAFNGKKNGVLAADVTVNDIVDQVLNIKLDNQGFAILVDGENDIVAYKDKELTGKPLTDLDSQFTPQLMQHLAKVNIPYEFNFAKDNKTKWIFVFPVKGTKWNLAVIMDKQTAMQHVDHQVWLSLMVTLGLFVVISLLGAVVISRLLKPLQELNHAIDELAEGDANLSYRLTIERDDEIGQVSASVNRFIGNLQTLITDVVQRTQKLDTISIKASQLSETTAGAINQQRQQVDQVATAIHEMSVSAGEVSSHAEMTADAAQSSSDACEQGQSIINQNMEAIGEVAGQLHAASQIISELEANVQGVHQILSNIQSIADQTNLLALNAAIEAARAGEHGRGFAVVADEVRVLSQRTHTATEEVTTIIGTLQSNAQRAVEAMDVSNQQAQTSVEFAQQANDRLIQITTAIGQISQMAIQIASAAEQQRAVSEDISCNTQNIRDTADEVASQACESNQQSRQIADEVSGISAQVNRFKL